MRKRVLDILTRQELQEAVYRFDLQVPDRWVKDQLVAALVRSRATLADVLEGLSRERPKEGCRAFRPDDTGREKAVLIERLTGQSSESASDVSALSALGGLTMIPDAATS